MNSEQSPRPASGNNPTPDITETLAQRGSAYGDFREQGRITQNLKRAMQDSPNWAKLPSYLKEGLDMIQHKVSRLLNGNALYDDNMHDIIGYTKLMQDRAKQDRDAGVVFQSPGDKLYPVYEHEDSPKSSVRDEPSEVLRGSEFPTERDYEERLAEAIRAMEGLGFTPQGPHGHLINSHGETAAAVLSDFAQFGMPTSGGMSHGLGLSADTRPVRHVPRKPEFLKDPVRAWMEARDRADATGKSPQQEPLKKG